MGPGVATISVTAASLDKEPNQAEPPDGRALLSFDSVHQFFHLDPNPYADVLSWSFLSGFRRLPDGRLVQEKS